MSLSTFNQFLSFYGGRKYCIRQSAILCKMKQQAMRKTETIVKSK